MILTNRKPQNLKKPFKLDDKHLKYLRKFEAHLLLVEKGFDYLSHFPNRGLNFSDEIAKANRACLDLMVLTDCVAMDEFADGVRTVFQLMKLGEDIERNYLDVWKELFYFLTIEFSKEHHREPCEEKLLG